MDPKKLSYKEIKARQKADLHSKIINIDIYRNFSTPFTYLFVKLGISPNTITILSFFLCIFGAFFLSIGTYPFLIAGIFFFLLFRIFDDSDGEVARIQNSQSIEGLYLDRTGHYISNLCLGIGLGFGLYRLYNSNIYIILGFVLIFVLTIETGIINLLSPILIKDEKDSLNKKASDRYIQKRMLSDINKKHSFSKQNIFSKLFSVYPTQGLIYSDYFIGPLLMILILIEFFLNIYSYFLMSFYTYNIGIIPLYLFVVCISKLIWIIVFIYKIEKHRPLTNFLK